MQPAAIYARPQQGRPMTRGRKRKSGPRHPKGKLVQSKPAERQKDIQAVVYEARQRVYDLSPAQAAMMPETSVLGFLNATGVLSAREYQAISVFRGIVEQYDRMMLARPVPSAGDLDRTHGHDASDGSDDAYVRRYDRAVGLFKRFTNVLRNCGDRFALACVLEIVTADFAIPFFNASIKAGGAALADELGLAKEAA